MTTQDKHLLGKKLWSIADRLRGAMDPDDFRDYMLAFLFLRYLSDNYEAAAKKELGTDFPVLRKDDRRSPLAVWYGANAADTAAFEKQMRRKIHYTIKPEFLWSSIAELARTQSPELLNQLEKVSTRLRTRASRTSSTACSVRSALPARSWARTMISATRNWSAL